MKEINKNNAIYVNNGESEYCIHEEDLQEFYNLLEMSAIDDDWDEFLDRFGYNFVKNVEEHIKTLK